MNFGRLRKEGDNDGRERGRVEEEGENDGREVGRKEVWKEGEIGERKESWRKIENMMKGGGEGGNWRE